MNYNCVVLGDINIDYATDLSQVSLQMIDNACINAPLRSYPMSVVMELFLLKLPKKQVLMTLS